MEFWQMKFHNSYKPFKRIENEFFSENYGDILKWKFKCK